jgi:anti-sigma factor RsiW
MKHNEARKKTTAFIDGELKEAEKASFEAHVEQCTECKTEVETIRNNDLFLRKAQPLEPAADFKSGLNGKIDGMAGRKPVFTLERLLPVPIALAVIVLFLSGILAVAPVLYAANSNGKASVTAIAGKALAACMTGSIFAPAAFAKFCDACNMNMCACCSAKTGQKCTMGGHDHGK